MNRLQIIPGRGQLAKIKQYSKEGTLTTAVIDAILSETRPVSMQVTLKKDRLRQYFPQSYTARHIEEVIFSLLENWRNEHTDNGKEAQNG